MPCLRRRDELCAPALSSSSSSSSSSESATTRRLRAAVELLELLPDRRWSRSWRPALPPRPSAPCPKSDQKHCPRQGSGVRVADLPGVC